MNMQTAAGGAGDGGPKRPKYSGFWHFAAEMDRLDLWPRMDDAFVGRQLEGASSGRADSTAELEQARQAWLAQGAQGRKH